MSRSHSSSPASLNSATAGDLPYLRFNSPAEYQSWLAQFCQKNGEGMRAQNISIIDFNTFKPDERLTTKFQCTPQLTGLLYPSPASPDLYMLEFIDRSGERVDVTDLDIYDVGELGDGTRQIIYPMGSLPDTRGTVDLYTLNPGSIVEICAKDKVLNRVSFIYTGRGNAKPCIE